MKKIIVFILCLTALALGSDREGQSNVMVFGDMMTRFCAEILPMTSTPYKQIDSTTVIELLNSAALEASTDLFCVERDTTLVMVAGTMWYNLPSDFYDVPVNMAQFGVVSIGSGTSGETGMKTMSVSEMGLNLPMSSSNEIPTRYIIRKGQIYIEPVNNDGDTVRVYYAAYANLMVTDTSGTDTSNIDKSYMEYVILSAAAKYLTAANWVTADAYRASRLAIVQGNLAAEEKRLGIIKIEK